MINRFGLLLKYYRERAGLSQAKLAQGAGYDHSFVSRLESGVRMPTRDAVTDFAYALTLTDDEQNQLLDAAGFSVSSLRGLVYEPMTLDFDQLIATSGPQEQEDLRALLRLGLRSGLAQATA